MRAYEIAVDMVKDEYLKMVEEVIDSGRLILGEYTKNFENVFAADHKRKFGISCNSDTSALEMVLDAIGVSGRPVLLPDASFFGCVNVILKCGGVPVPVPCRLENGLMPLVDQWLDFAKMAEDRFKRKPVALFVYTGGGASVDASAAVDSLSGEGIMVIEDAAHCHGATYTEGGLVGKYGLASTFSFYATKLIHCGEGGIVLTNEDWLEEHLRVRRDYGRGIINEVVEPVEFGYNWRMTEMQAALGLALWNKRSEIIAARKKIAEIYDSSFLASWRMTPHWKRPGNYSPSLYRYIVINPKLKEGSRTLKNLQALAEASGIPFQAKTNSRAIQEFKLYKAAKCLCLLPGLERSHTPWYCRSHLCLPIHPKMTQDDATKVVRVFESVFGEGVKNDE